MIDRIFSYLESDAFDDLLVKAFWGAMLILVVDVAINLE